MFQAITFDLWQTLIFDGLEVEERRKNLRFKRLKPLLQSNGFEFSEEEFALAHQEVWDRCTEIWEENRDISSQEQIKIFLDCLPAHRSILGQAGFGNSNLSPSGFLEKTEKAYTEVIYEEPPTLIEGTKKVLEELKTKGMKIGLICNTGRTPGYCLRTLLREYQIFGYFDAFSFSNELLIRKPDPEIFLLTLQQMNASLSSSIHIGDNLYTDVWGAKQAGMRAIKIGQDLTGEEKQTDRLQIKPDAVITNLRELIPLLSFI
ncbi:MAG: HAD family hydrolase [Candidatus Edwardsbacteria bacterium]